ncbi:MAG: aminopeptidase P family protein [Methanomicrobium sp.]|nr:aminopeptidase P family protein [Methanomicrobium sp.]
MKNIDELLKSANADAYILYAGSRDPDMRYISEFNVSDPLLCVRCAGKRPALIVPQMEKERALAESACDVLTRGELEFFNYYEEFKDGFKAKAKMTADYVAANALNGIGDRDGNAGGRKPVILVPENFPIVFAKELENYCTLVVDRGGMEKIRSIKTEDEIAKIRACQAVNERALAFAVGIIKTAPSDNGELRIPEGFAGEGEPLTSDVLRGLIECFFLKNGCVAEETIVSCGAETAMPHNIGHGVLCENEPIVLDIFPRDTKTGYFSDMTRTVLRGEASRELVKLYETVAAGKKLGESMIRAGVKGCDVHNAVLKYFEDSGYHTETEGFIHSLGHGVGLAIHEQPSLSPSGGEVAHGNIVTVEPGLYYKDIGGVRLEDMGLVTEGGFDCFTKAEEKLVL